LGLTVKSLDDFRQRVAEITGRDANSFWIKEENCYIVEDEDYLKLGNISSGFYITPKTALELTEERNLNSKIRLEQESGNIVIEEKNLEELSAFEKRSMEFMHQLTQKDPSLLPAESTPLFWRYCDSIGDKNFANLAKNILLKSPLEVFGSAGFREISLSQWEEIVQSEHIQCTEYELIASFAKWAGVNDVVIKRNEERVHKIVSQFRLGQFTLPQLLKEIHQYRTVLTSKVIYPFVRYFFLAKEKSSPFIAQNRKLFTLREFQHEHYKLGQLVSSETELMCAAKGLPWTLTMSSEYAGLPNNYSSLVDGNWNLPGCATNYGGTQYIEAAFDIPVSVTKLILSSPTKGLFASQGWGYGYISQLSLHYLRDDKFELVKNLAGTADKDGPIEIDLTEFNLVGQKFRLISAAYVCTGSFILE